MTLTKENHFVDSDIPTIFVWDPKAGSSYHWSYISYLERKKPVRWYTHAEKYEFMLGNLDLPTEFKDPYFESTYSELFKAGQFHRGTSAPMSIFGSTMAAGSKAAGYVGEGDKCVPRPNSKSFPDGTAGMALKEEHVVELAEMAENRVLDYLFHLKRWEEVDVLRKFKEKCHQDLLVCGTIFTGMALVNNLEDGYNHIHKDLTSKYDIIIMVGTGEITGGKTLFYSNKQRDVIHSEDFLHGKFIVGPFDSVRHSGEEWTGKRGIISFYVNAHIFWNQLHYGPKPYLDFLKRKEAIKRKNEAKNQKKGTSKQKKKRSGYLLLPDYAKCTGTLRSCLQDSVVNAARQLGIEFNGSLFLQRCPPRKCMDTSMEEIVLALEEWFPETLSLTFENVWGREKGGPEFNLLCCRDGGV